MITSAILTSWLPFLTTVIFFSAILWLSKYLLFTRSKKNNLGLFPRQAAILAIIIISLIALVISLPIPENTQIQILSMIGLVLSALLAYSSTAIFSNLMAGAMMRFTQPFRTGDYIQAEKYFGRVTERGLLDCEIQTSNREFVSIPNSWLINRPIEVIRDSGTIVSSTLSLGYDLHHEIIRPLLKTAAATAGLSEPYVHIMELGDYSVTYRISGLLTDVKNLLTTRSNLHGHILDCLHAKEIEILSPTFMNQRAVKEGSLTMPIQKYVPNKSERIIAEDIVYDKAEAAEQLETLKLSLLQRKEEIQKNKADANEEDKAKLAEELEAIEIQLEKLSNLKSEDKA